MPESEQVIGTVPMASRGTLRRSARANDAGWSYAGGPAMSRTVAEWC